MKNVAEIIIKKDVNKILDLFCACFDIRILFYSDKGEVLKEGLDKTDSSFCSLIQNKLYGQERCLMMDETKRIEALNKKNLLYYPCHAGLMEAILPIFIENHLIGFAMLGQIRTRQNILPSLKKDWSKKYDASELEDAFNLLPYFPKKKINHILDLFSILIDYIIAKEMITVKAHLLIEKIVNYIKKNVYRKNIPLEEIAQYAGKSRYTIAHLLKKNLGTTFKKIFIEAKLDKAEEYFRTQPDITIAQAAEKLGYDDQFYFSRLYKKFRKIPPSEYIKNYRLRSSK